MDKSGSAVNADPSYNHASEYGWHIDHIVPVSRGGPDTLDILQPLHWWSNLQKSDAFPWDCSEGKPFVPFRQERDVT